jgi:nicotinate-nucleotide--dimethylbenzimidazole phosphoribosyltransferase
VPVANVPVVSPIDPKIERTARERLDSLTKPVGSLGLLEDVAAQLCGIAGRVPAPVPVRPAITVFAADHGVVASGVTHWPSEVTAQMVANFASGGAAISVLARQQGATLTVVDVGVSSALGELPGVRSLRVTAGTADLSLGAAMTETQVHEAFGVGVSIASELIADGADLLVTGEMGIGNTTSAAAIISVLTGQEAASLVGRGTGIDDAVFANKTSIVVNAVNRVNAMSADDPASHALLVLREVGGLEIAALAGYITASAAHRIPVLLDGVITLAAALVATQLVPTCTDYLLAGHRSTEPGATAALTHLALTPLIDLQLRLGEGSGAALAIPIVQAAAALLAQMATFQTAGVEDHT